MHFHIDADEGAVIRGWVVPDNPSVTPSIIVIIPNRPETVIKADILRSDIRELGLHATGTVGFKVTEAQIPKLARFQDVEIVESESRIPLYKRFHEKKHRQKKMMHFDLSIMPQINILKAMSSHFSLTYNSAERYSFETLLVIMNNHFSKSILITGRPNLNRYENWLREQEFVLTAMLRNPYEELAERLLFIRFLSGSAASHLLPTLCTGLESIIPFATELPLGDDRTVAAAFRATNPMQREALRSPMVRCLGASLDDPLNHRHVGTALDKLATMDLVAIRPNFSEFKSSLAEILGIDMLGDSAVGSLPGVDELTQQLTRIGMATTLLEYDLALYSYVEEAVTAGIQKSREERDADKSPSAA